MARSVISAFVWLVRCEGDRSSVFCAPKRASHIAGNVYGLCHVRLLSGSACELKMAARCMRHLNESVLGGCLAFLCLCCMRHLHILWSLKQCLELTLRLSGPECVL